MTAKTSDMMLATNNGTVRETGSTKLGTTPGGGARAGILEYFASICDFVYQKKKNCSLRSGTRFGMGPLVNKVGQWKVQACKNSPQTVISWD